MRNIETITNNVDFKSVKGIDICKDFYDEAGKLELESVIESVYCNSLLRASSGKVDVLKKKFVRGTTDGFLRFRFKENIVEFYGIQECKRDIKRNKIAYADQVGQALLYFIQCSQSCKVIILNSVNYFDYIIVDENKEYIEEHKDNWINLLKEKSPSKACKDIRYVLNNIKIHTCDVPTPAEIDKILLTIYRICV